MVGKLLLASNVAKHDCNIELTFYSKFNNLQKQLHIGCNINTPSQFTATFNPFVWRDQLKSDQPFVRMACFERASPALKDILLKLYR